MRLSFSVLSLGILVAWAIAGPAVTPPPVDALERKVASLLPDLRSATLSSRLPAATALASVLEQAASDIAEGADGLGLAALAVLDDMIVVVHDALGGSRAPWAARIDSALARLLRVTSVAPDEFPEPAPIDLVMNPSV